MPQTLTPRKNFAVSVAQTPTAQALMLQAIRPRASARSGYARLPYVATQCLVSRGQTTFWSGHARLPNAIDNYIYANTDKLLC